MTISISCIATILHEDSILAIRKTLSCLNVSKIYWFSDVDFPEDVNCEIVNIRINHFNQKINFTDQYSYLTLKVMPEVVTTDYNLIIQYDGYAVNKDAWTDQFLNYDYIGAVWPYFSKNKVGNGGFCLRSKKLYNALKAIDIKYKWSDLVKANLNPSCHKWTFDKFKPKSKSLPEDIIISQVYRKQLENKYKIKFAPERIANQFSIESNLSSPWLMKSFGFHGTKLYRIYNSNLPLLLID